MDKTQTYIKMCDCEEIQSSKPHKDWIDIDFSEAPYYSSDGNCWYRIVSEPREYIWLPRQDQLQEMISGSAYAKLQNFFIAVRDFRLTPYHHSEKAFPFTSMEQLWLAFVMKEKYSKVWNGEEWVNANL